MILAAVEGVIDFSQYDPRDYNWQIWLNLAMEAVEQRRAAQLYQAIHAHYLVGAQLWPEDDDLPHWKSASETLQHLAEQLMPWTRKEAGAEVQERRSVAAEMKNVWEAQWGPMDDPETLKRISETVEFLDKGTAR